MPPVGEFYACLNPSTNSGRGDLKMSPLCSLRSLPDEVRCTERLL